MRSRSRGYGAILLTVFVPLILYGTKWALDSSTANDWKIAHKVARDQSENATVWADTRKSAKSITENWNPGLTFPQQKDGLYKILDIVYNVSLNSMNKAIPGVDVVEWERADKSDNLFTPIRTKVKSVISSISQLTEIGYTTHPKYMVRDSFYKYDDNGGLWNPGYAMWRGIDVNTSPEYRVSAFDEIDQDKLASGETVLKQHEIFLEPALHLIGGTSRVYNSTYYPNNTRYSIANSSKKYYSSFVVTTPGKNSSYRTYNPNRGYNGNTSVVSSPVESTYTTKTMTGTPIAIDNDKIKVVGSNGTVGYAVPAECNVDIVLAVPVNGAASNQKNQDAASDSDTPGEPISDLNAAYGIPDEVKKTPIYQMGQACKEFVKEFYHTRGVTMGLIPYSAKVSISPDKTSYTAPIPAFTEPTSSPRVIIGACLYSTKGEKDAKLAQSVVKDSTCYKWNEMLMGCPIMCRQGYEHTEARYGGNKIAQGILTSIEEPKQTSDPNNLNYYFYRRMNMTPCIGGYANFLSMKCERECTHFLPNPYYMIEPTADLVKIYEMCNALYPFYDTKNVSNFLFIPLEWARNFWQSWTNNPGRSATSDQLSIPSKMTTGRKKVLILLVNKPDWFEPGELTYLGFDNDLAEIPMVEGDKIDFSINYSETDKKFLDGSNFDGTIAGPKKILKFEKVSGNNLNYKNGYYEATGTYKLKFPRKGLVKLTVAQPTMQTGTVTFYDTNITDSNSSTYDVRKDSTSGTKISLNSAQTVTGTQTFVFSGGTMPVTGTTSAWGGSDKLSSTLGSNFCHNLSVKKVRYSLSNATITNCTLKKQILRDYFGVYGRYQSSYKALILNNGTTAIKSGESSYSVYSTYNYTSSSGKVTIGSDIDKKWGQFRDSCVVYLDTEGRTEYYIYNSDSSSRLYIGTGSYVPELYVLVYGVSPAFVVSAGINGSTVHVAYFTTSNSYVDFLAGSTNGWWVTSSDCTEASGYGNSGIKLKFYNTSSGSAWFYQYFIQNQNNKTLQSTTQITEDPITYQNLIGNKGIYLANYNDENWICFQGDGELHVTVAPLESYVKVNGTKTNITSISQTVTVPSSAFTKQHGRWVATVTFYNAYITKAQQDAGTWVRDIIQSKASGNCQLSYSYEDWNNNVTKTTSSSSGQFYVDLPFGCLGKNAAIKFSKKEVVFDVIDFSSSTNGKNNVMFLYGAPGSNTNYYYTIGSSSKNGQLYTTQKGDIELTVAPAIGVSSGSIKIGSKSAETVDRQKTYKILSSDMQNWGDDRYNINLTMSNLILIKAKFIFNPELSFPYDIARSQILDWRNQNIMTAGTNILVSDLYNNYVQSEGYHQLNTGNCQPKVYDKSFNAEDVSTGTDISVVIDAKTKLFLNWYMPDFCYEDGLTWFTGAVRLFSPRTRDSARKFSHICPRSDTYNNRANLIAHSFAMPYNSVLCLNGYQGASDTPTAGVRAATAAVCEKLKEYNKDNKDDLRIYVVKYRNQEKYKTFPFEVGDQSNELHDYSGVDALATKGCLYGNDKSNPIDTQAKLETTLKTIANDIKKWQVDKEGGEGKRDLYSAARNVSN